MPPIKGRMMGMQDCAALKAKGPFKGKRRFSRPLITDGSLLPDVVKNDKPLMELRIPDELCKGLPSVKKFHSGKNGKQQTSWKKSEWYQQEDDDCEITGSTGGVLGIKRRKGQPNKYHVKKVAERNFSSMIWDVAFMPSGELIVSCADGTWICDDSLTKQTKLEHTMLGGGIAFLSDGKILTICRNFDVVNIYTPKGSFIKSFPAGTSPTALTVNSRDEIIVSDTGINEDKCIWMYEKDGTLIRKIPGNGTGYRLLWPLYVHIADNDSFLIVDCMSQRLLEFDYKGRFVRHLQLKIQSGSEVMRPHGLCLNDQMDLFVIDNATDSVEVFGREDVYMQTLLPFEEGQNLKPKALRISDGGSQMVIGGMAGYVRIYEFVSAEEAKRYREEQARLKAEAEANMDIIVLD